MYFNINLGCFSKNTTIKGYFLNSSNSSFSKCYEGCLECEEKSDYCVDCAPGFYKLSFRDTNATMANNTTLGKYFNCLKNCPGDYMINKKENICKYFLIYLGENINLTSLDNLNTLFNITNSENKTKLNNTELDKEQIEKLNKISDCKKLNLKISNYFKIEL